jgi:hypothetical protein
MVHRQLKELMTGDGKQIQIKVCELNVGEIHQEINMFIASPPPKLNFKAKLQASIKVSFLKISNQ